MWKIPTLALFLQCQVGIFPHIAIIPGIYPHSYVPSSLAHYFLLLEPYFIFKLIIFVTLVINFHLRYVIMIYQAHLHQSQYRFVLTSQSYVG